MAGAGWVGLVIRVFAAVFCHRGQLPVPSFQLAVSSIYPTSLVVALSHRPLMMNVVSTDGSGYVYPYGFQAFCRGIPVGCRTSRAGCSPVAAGSRHFTGFATH